MAVEGEKRRYITSKELRGHNTPGNLWISIQGKVYDVTEWVKHHPGGDLPLLNLAGQDVTDAFVAYHPGTAWALLDRFCSNSAAHGRHLACTRAAEFVHEGGSGLPAAADPDPSARL